MLSLPILLSRWRASEAVRPRSGNSRWGGCHGRGLGMRAYFMPARVRDALNGVLGAPPLGRPDGTHLGDPPYPIPLFRTPIVT